jgi:large-conductance mechanosensitive channel
MATTKKEQSAPEPEQPEEERPKLTKAANRRRGVKEVTTKLKGMPPVAQAEVVNDVVTEQVSKQFSGFKEFLRDQSVIGIGIGLVLGTQIKTVVDTIMASLVNPLTSLFLPGQDALTAQKVTIHLNGKEAVIGWGAVVYSIFTFLVVAAIVYAIYKILRLDKLAKKKG